MPAPLPRTTKVGFVTDIVTPYMVAVLGALAERVDLTALFCARTGTRGADWTFDAPFPFRHRVLTGPTIRRRTPDAADVYPNPRILSALLAARPDAVISGAFSFPSLASALYGRLTGGRLIIHSDGTSDSERVLGRAHLLARRVLLHEAAACVANSEPAAARFVELGAPSARVFRAPHTTDIARFHAVGRARAARPRGEGPITVLHVGRLIPRKGIDRLLRALALASTDADVRLVLVGSGPEEEPLRTLAARLGIAERVAFRGFVDQPALPAVYAEADVFAFPTLDDPFGIVLLEAMATGLPVVASPHGGATPDLVENGVNGFVVLPDDTAGWSRALLALARDPALRRGLGERARAVTVDRTPERAALGYVAAVQAALSEAGGVRRRRARAERTGSSR
jgi:glycosyltransferase involved in cell wall biosynthesis